jgi:hypothetical protein
MTEPPFTLLSSRQAKEEDYTHPQSYQRLAAVWLQVRQESIPLLAGSAAEDRTVEVHGDSAFTSAEVLAPHWPVLTVKAALIVEYCLHCAQ